MEKIVTLLCIQREGGVDKSRVVNEIELRFSLFSGRADLVLAISTSATASNIERSTIYTCLGTGVRNSQRRINKDLSIWTQCYVLIINEISIIELNILSNIAIQLAKVRGLSNKSTLIFGEPLIIIFIKDFYKFSSMIGWSFWEEVYTIEDLYNKMLWTSFNTIITLTQQMRQINNSIFNTLLHCTCIGFLIDANVVVLNSKVAKEFSLHNILKNTIIVEKNKFRYMINQLWVE